MARDAKLDRLGTMQDIAHHRKQAAHQTKELALEHLIIAREAMSATFAEKEYAQAAIRTTWQIHTALRRTRRRLAQRHNLVVAASEALSQHNNAKLTFKEASDAHATARQAFRRARNEYVRAKENFEEEEARIIAVKVGVPSPYFGRVKVRPTREGGYDIFFGGDYFPLGDWHGHYATDEFGELTYKRGPREPHGAHNWLHPRKKSPVRW